MVAGTVDGFDVIDASIGAALGLAVALLAVAGARLWQRINRRARTVGAWLARAQPRGGQRWGGGAYGLRPTSFRERD